MKFTRRGSTLYLRKRVPKRYHAVEEREYVWLSLHTDSESVARAKYPRVWGEMIEAWEAKLEGAKAEEIPLRFNTEGLSIKDPEKRTRPPFSADWIREKILAPGALNGLNPEARGILIGMVNTGYRPSEGAMLTRDQIVLGANVPHLRIEPVNGRQLKTQNSRRVIPLAGVSLEAFRAHPDGFPRYVDNPALSDTVNKFLRENGLLETPEHSMYSLRHSFEDRMLAAGTDERIRRDLMGHALKRERYGRGADLAHLHKVVQAIAL